MPLKIMAVDDEVEILRVIEVVGGSVGCDVLALTDSLEAAERVNHQKFDGIFLDVKMPRLDGFELTRRIRTSRSNSTVPIVMLTGLNDAETMRIGFQAGITFFLGKPFTVEKLRGLLTVARGAMLKEKRRYARLPLRTGVSGRAGAKKFKSDSSNISQAGMLLNCPSGLAVGQEVDLQFSLPNAQEVLRLQAQVVRLEPPDRMGVKFVVLAPREHAAILHYITGRVKE